jgi:hypothetical protein
MTRTLAAGAALGTLALFAAILVVGLAALKLSELFGRPLPAAEEWD